MIELDGSFGEGGGQILRTSLALSLITGQAFHLANVRARRPKPGLAPQHLMSVQSAAAVGSAEVQGASLRSTDLVFRPGKVRSGNYRFSIGTAGSTGLVLQTIYLPLMWNAATTSKVTLEGGTHVQTSPCFHFLDITWRQYIGLLGMRLHLGMARAGFYPRGGGVAVADLEPCAAIQGLCLDQVTKPTHAMIHSAAAGLPEHIIGRQARRAQERLRPARLKVRTHMESWDGGPGTFLGVSLDTKPARSLFFALGARGKPAEQVADEAVAQVHDFLGHDSGLDAHSADQLVLPLALAQGPSDFPVAEVTSHLLTNIEVIRRFVSREIVCQGEIGQSGRVRIADG